MKTDFSRYSAIVASGMILPKKRLYTAKDVKDAILDSLFKGPRTLEPKEAAAVVKCSAHFHETDFSRAVRRIGQTNTI